jgi:hypothetical protein
VWLIRRCPWGIKTKPISLIDSGATRGLPRASTEARRSNLLADPTTTRRRKIAQDFPPAVLVGSEVVGEYEPRSKEHSERYVIRHLARRGGFQHCEGMRARFGYIGRVTKHRLMDLSLCER